MGTYHRYYGQEFAGRRLRIRGSIKAIAATAAAAISITGLVMALSRPARADPPPPLSETAFTVPTVVCTTKDQAVSIATAAHDSTEAMLTKYQELAATKACVNSPIPYLVVNEREDFGLGHAANGDMVHMWVIHGGTARGEFWLIYAESDQQTNIWERQLALAGDVAQEELDHLALRLVDRQSREQPMLAAARKRA